MSDTATLKLCVLHETELRAAAKLLLNAVQLEDDAERFGKAIQDALNACIVALHGAERDDHVLVVVNATELLKRRLLIKSETR